MGQEPTNGKGRKEVVMTPAEARTKKLAKGYQYVPASEDARPQPESTPTGKRERKKPVHADFVVCQRKVDVDFSFLLVFS